LAPTRSNFGALGNRRFRWLLLALAGIPIAISYSWWTLVLPFLTRPAFSDQDFVYTASAAIRSRSDPYAWIASGYTYGRPVYIYPPLWAWLQQPLVPIGRENTALVLLVLLQLCLAGFLALLYRALRPVDWQEIALGAILAVAYVPVLANLWSDQVNLVVLLAGAFALSAYVAGDRWWGGAAYGVAMALKPLQPAVGLLLVFGRRRRMVVAAALVGILASLLPGPRLLGRYLEAVFGAAAGATGFRDNAAPAGFVQRLLHPASFYDGSAPADVAVRAVFVIVILLVVGVSWWRLGSRPRTRPLGRSLELAAGAAASPLLLSIAHSFHLVLLLLPILVLLHAGLARQDRLAVGMAVGAWLLVGPVHGAMLSAIGAGLNIDALLRIWNESQLAGILLLWLGCLRALDGASELQRHAVARRLDLDAG
jgi:hypothetical protein